MSKQTQLQRAAELMRAEYGVVDLPEADSTWGVFLRVLFGVTSSHKAYASFVEMLKSSAIATPMLATQASAGQLVELLEPIPRGPQKSSLVRTIASWWLEQFGNELTPEWSRGTSFYRESLRAIRGLGPATVDELLLFAARLKVFPIDRTVLRVTIRHGWLDMPVEDDDAQSFFLRNLESAEQSSDMPNIDPREFSRLLTLVGENHCGREPKCDGCPLQSMLPQDGPLSPESC